MSSPLGVSYFQIMRTRKYFLVATVDFVSVPSRGILFPNRESLTNGKTFLNWFPSPLGVSYFQILSLRSRAPEFLMFPSPLGVSYFQIISLSVPSSAQTIFVVSVPSRGILFPNMDELRNLYGSEEIEFPSPLGVSYFQILPARARYFTGFSDSFAWQIIFLYIFLISNIHNRLQMQYLCGARQNYLFF